MELLEIRTIKEFQNYISHVLVKRNQEESRIIKENGKLNEKSFLKGYCELCQKDSKFIFQVQSDQKPNFRESLFCEYCKNNNRSRFMLSFLKKMIARFNQTPTIFMLEQVTDTFKYAKTHFIDINLIGSEFLGYDKKPGEIINNIRHEDAMNLSFEDNSLDIIVSNDVFEHIPNIFQALKEAYRVLKKNGMLLVSIPFYAIHKKTICRAVLENGEIKNLLPEVHHGNPLSEKGSLVFYDYGWNFLDFLKDAGFSDAYMLAYYSMLYGYLGDANQFIFVAKKL